MGAMRPLCPFRFSTNSSCRKDALPGSDPGGCGASRAPTLVQQPRRVQWQSMVMRWPGTPGTQDDLSLLRHSSHVTLPARSRSLPTRAGAGPLWAGVSLAAEAPPSASVGAPSMQPQSSQPSSTHADVTVVGALQHVVPEVLPAPSSPAQAQASMLDTQRGRDLLLAAGELPQPAAQDTQRCAEATGPQERSCQAEGPGLSEPALVPDASATQRHDAEVPSSAGEVCEAAQRHPPGGFDVQAVAALQGQRLRELAQSASSGPDGAAVSAQQHAAVLALLTKWRNEALRQHQLRVQAERALRSGGDDMPVRSTQVRYRSCSTLLWPCTGATRCCRAHATPHRVSPSPPYAGCGRDRGDES